ncbi:ATP synthase subunit I [Hydrogenophaga sp. PAMC20947]|uniref:ATP synthase subunit I n=1 Tax=Hydrogenophaga sp. PAMC20947 TaxID=2565558 RepID=UPI00109E11AC|nr:ATP synthase subunit I [Hydrogenophaga sp. PAMC20947]QCB45418.1 ATP synthase subunit I [Hydrogenophaga sp. PAMC20947]
MTMLDVLWPLMAGFVFGGVFFGGLWWTVRHAADFRWPGPSMLASVLLRMATVLGGLYLVGNGEWTRMLLYLLGLLMARLAVTWATRLPPPVSPSNASGEARHAP